MTVDALFRKTGAIAFVLLLAACLIGFGTADLIGSARLADATRAQRMRHRALVRGAKHLPYAPEWSDLATLRAAVRIAPTAAEARYQIGRTTHRVAIRASAVDPAERREIFQAAESGYRRAIRLNQSNGNAYFWRAILHAWAVRGGLGPMSDAMVAEHEAIVERSIGAARRLRPYDAQIAYEAGVLSLEDGKREGANAAFAASLAVSPRYLDEIVVHLVDEGGAADLDAIVPETAAARLELSGALFRRNQTGEAYRQWRLGRELAGETARETGPLEGRIANGGFEHALGETFHDWAMQPVPGVGGSIVSDETGARRFQVDFDRAPANFFHLVQRVPVASLARYRLSARLTSADLPPGERIGIEALAAGSGDYLCGTAVAPNADWTEAACEFTVPRGVWAVDVRVRKAGEDGAESSGAMTVDDVALVEIPSGDRR